MDSDQIQASLTDPALPAYRTEMEPKAQKARRTEAWGKGNRRWRKQITKIFYKAGKE